MRSVFLFLCSLLLCVGCGSNVVPVAGRVTLDKKPLVNAVVSFQPESDAVNPGPGSQGRSNANGEYTLQLLTKDVKGAVLGKHKISITAYEGDDGKAPSSGSDMVFRKAIVPRKYNAESTLFFDVPAGGTSSANFDLDNDQK